MTVGFHINAITGDVSGEKDGMSSVPAGKEIFQGQPETTFLTPFENCGTKSRVLAVVDSTPQVGAIVV